MQGLFLGTSTTGRRAADGEPGAVRRALLALLAAVLALPLAAAADPPAPIEDHVGPAEPRRDFPADFLPLLPHDAQQERASQTKWDDPRVGGWGGHLAGGPSCKGTRVVPLVLVHGTTHDAENWRQPEGSTGQVVNVRQHLLDAGWHPCRLWAVSYTGASGYFTYNDINVEEVWSFLRAVQGYLGASGVDVVAHSLGVTVVRKAGLRHPELYRSMRSFVAIAGPNHGTTTCRGVGQAHGSYVCEEIEPGSAWLAALNRGPRGLGETPPGPRYMALYEGTGTTDTFYLGPEDAKSPRLEGRGVCNTEMPNVAHNTLAFGAEPVARWMRFLQTGRCA